MTKVANCTVTAEPMQEVDQTGEHSIMLAWLLHILATQILSALATTLFGHITLELTSGAVTGSTSLSTEIRVLLPVTFRVEARRLQLAQFLVSDFVFLIEIKVCCPIFVVIRRINNP